MAEKLKFSRARRMVYARAVLRVQDAYAVKLQRSLSQELRRAAREMAAEYKSTGKVKAAKKAHEKRLKAIFTAALPAVVRAFVKLPTAGVKKGLTLVREEKRKVSVSVQKPGDPTDDLQLERDVIEFVTRGALSTAPGIASTTEARARTVIARGLREGLSQAAISQNISKTLGGLTSASRAATIARTTIHTAANVSQYTGAKATGLTYKREWISTNDDRVREIHQEADGQRVDGDEEFEVGGESLAYPGDPNGSPENICNCRCVVGYIFPED